MVHHRRSPRITLLFCLAMTGLTSACAAQPPKPAQPPSEPAVVHDSVSGGTVDELHRLMDAHALTELRTTYNGTYGASLLFYPDKLSYYVVLFHNKDFWRVIKTSVVADAESIYSTFSKQTRKLAQVDIDTIRLQAGKRYTQQMVAMNQHRLQSLRTDLQRQQQQAQQIAQQQQQAQQQAVSLSSDLRSSSQQLTHLQQRIQALESEQSNPELQLPPPGSQAPAAPSSAPAAAGNAPPAAAPSAQP